MIKKATVFSILFILFSQSLFSQIVGTVIDQTTNKPIANALIYREGNPGGFKKTDTFGTFNIAGSLSDKYFIAALGYETKKSFSFNSATNIIVKMAIDPLLATDDYHISFDHMRPGPSYKETELRTDFPVANGIGFSDGVNAITDRAMVDNTVSRDLNGNSLRIKFPKQKLKPAESGVDTRIPLAKTFKDNDYNGDGDVYLSYWIKFSDNFEFDKCGGKLPSLGGSDWNSRDNGWKGRIMWRNQGSVQFYMEVPHLNDNLDDDEERFWGGKLKNNGSICKNDYISYLKSPGWHNIELHYRMDNGKPDQGVFEGWVDGDKGYKKIDSEVFGYYRPGGTSGLYGKLTTNAILISAFLGGSDDDYKMTQDTYIWVDEFRVSKNRINEWNKYNGVVSGQENESIENNVLIFPNPSEGIFKMTQNSNFNVLNQMGEIVLSGNNDSIDLSSFDNGIYFIQCENQFHKVLKNK